MTHEMKAYLEECRNLSGRIQGPDISWKIREAFPRLIEIIEAQEKVIKKAMSFVTMVAEIPLPANKENSQVLIRSMIDSVYLARQTLKEIENGK